MKLLVVQVVPETTQISKHSQKNICTILSILYLCRIKQYIIPKDRKFKGGEEFYQNMQTEKTTNNVFPTTESSCELKCIVNLGIHMYSLKCFRIQHKNHISPMKPSEHNCK